MTQCPDCKSDSVQSKGLRTKGVHRFLCNNCGRNFTVRDTTIEAPIKVPISTEVNTITEDKKDRITIQIDTDLHKFLISQKVIPQEPINSVIKRLIDRTT